MGAKTESRCHPSVGMACAIEFNVPSSCGPNAVGSSRDMTELAPNSGQPEPIIDVVRRPPTGARRGCLLVPSRTRRSLPRLHIVVGHVSTVAICPQQQRGGRALGRVRLARQDGGNEKTRWCLQLGRQHQSPSGNGGSTQAMTTRHRRHEGTRNCCRDGAGGARTTASSFPGGELPPSETTRGHIPLTHGTQYTRKEGRGATHQQRAGGWADTKADGGVTGGRRGRKKRTAGVGLGSNFLGDGGQSGSTARGGLAGVREPTKRDGSGVRGEPEPEPAGTAPGAPAGIRSAATRAGQFKFVFRSSAQRGHQLAIRPSLPPSFQSASLHASIQEAICTHGALPRPNCGCWCSRLFTVPAVKLCPSDCDGSSSGWRSRFDLRHASTSTVSTRGSGPQSNPATPHHTTPRHAIITPPGPPTAPAGPARLQQRHDLPIRERQIV